MKKILIFALFLSTQAAFSQQLDEQYVTLRSSNERVLKDNYSASFWFMDETEINGVTIPKGTRFTAVADFTGDRAILAIAKLIINEVTYQVPLTIVGPDLNEGIPINKKKGVALISGNWDYKFLVKNM